jgi:hypothetical protein
VPIRPPARPAPARPCARQPAKPVTRPPAGPVTRPRVRPAPARPPVPHVRPASAPA